MRLTQESIENGCSEALYRLNESFHPSKSGEISKSRFLCEFIVSHWFISIYAT